MGNCAIECERTFKIPLNFLRAHHGVVELDGNGSQKPLSWRASRSDSDSVQLHKIDKPFLSKRLCCVFEKEKKRKKRQKVEIRSENILGVSERRRAGI